MIEFFVDGLQYGGQLSSTPPSVLPNQAELKFLDGIREILSTE